MLDHARRIAADMIEIRQRVEHVACRSPAGDDNRQIAKSRIFSEHREERLDHARGKSFTDNNAVHRARVEVPAGRLDAEGTEKTETFAKSDRQGRIGPAATGQQDG